MIYGCGVICSCWLWGVVSEEWFVDGDSYIWSDDVSVRWFMVGRGVVVDG